jgi:hypothetical protein
VLDDWQEASGLWTIPHTAAGKSLIGGPTSQPAAEPLPAPLSRRLDPLLRR